MYVYICEDTPEGIFTAIYNIYEDRHNLPDTRLMTQWEPLLLAEYISVKPDTEKSGKVLRTIYRTFGEADVHSLFFALSAPDGEKAEAVYKTIAYGLKNKVSPGHLFDHLADRYVLKTFKLAKNAGRECHHFMGFLRFQELENGILFAAAEPRNHVLAELMEHFSDRFPGENFMILDEGRRLFGVHKAGEKWFLTNDNGISEKIKMTSLSEKEGYYAGLFRHFCKSIAIKERKNTDLQMNMLPLRYRAHMTEFQ